MFSTAIGTIKTIFVANKAGKATYLMTVLDSLIYIYLVKSIAASTGIAVVVYVLGKVAGAVLGDILESKIGIGIYDIELYISDHETQKKLQQMFIQRGFSSTMNIGTINENNVRWSNNLQIARRDMDEFYSILEEVGIANPTMVVRPVKRVSGKIAERV